MGELYSGLMVRDQIENAINYPLVNELPHQWKICRLRTFLKESGVDVSNVEDLCSRIVRFYDQRAPAIERELFQALFGIRYTVEARKAFSLGFRDIIPNPSKTHEVGIYVTEVLKQSLGPAARLISGEKVLFALTELYQLPYYSWKSYFSFEDLSESLVRQVRGNELEAQELSRALAVLAESDLPPKMNSDEPTMEFELVRLRAPSQDGDHVVETPSAERFHSLTQAEWDWLQSLARLDSDAMDRLPIIKGTAARSDLEHPESLQTLLEVVRRYDARLGFSLPLDLGINQRVRSSIRERAQKVLKESRVDPTMGQEE